MQNYEESCRIIGESTILSLCIFSIYRVITSDNAEYLFLADSGETLGEWVTKLGFHAQLPPSMQLMSYDNHKVLFHYFFFVEINHKC